MDNALRGDGLIRAQSALTALEDDPHRLDHARGRFEESPPLYASDRSYDSTRSQSPNPPSEAQRTREERKWQLIKEREESRPYYQFLAQRIEERERILAADLDGTYCAPAGSDFSHLAYEEVKRKWIQQGIWNDTWDKTADGKWKHEESPEPESEPDAELASNERPSNIFTSNQPVPTPKRPKTDEEKRDSKEQRMIREREREASRPIHQFMYQVSEERTRIRQEATDGVAIGTAKDPADINTKAYENVKKTWVRRSIWNDAWGVLPGMSWKHEDPFDEAAFSADAHEFNQITSGTDKDAEDVPRPFAFGSDTRDEATPSANGNNDVDIGPSSTSLVESKHPIAVELPEDGDSTDGVDRSSRVRTQDEFAEEHQLSPPSRTPQSESAGADQKIQLQEPGSPTQNQDVDASTRLHEVRSSKVSEAPNKKDRPQPAEDAPRRPASLFQT